MIYSTYEDMLKWVYVVAGVIAWKVYSPELAEACVMQFKQDMIRYNKVKKEIFTLEGMYDINKE